MKRRLSEIQIIPYGDRFGDITIIREPSDGDIKQAIDAQQYELRGYQTDREALMAEWMHGSKGGQNLQEWGQLVKSYHARRIAYFVVEGWSDPIVLNVDGRLVDGLHRIKAAKYKGMEEVEIVIAT